LLVVCGCKITDLFKNLGGLINKMGGLFDKTRKNSTFAGRNFNFSI
jgi:hypothetical protein